MSCLRLKPTNIAVKFYCHRNFNTNFFQNYKLIFPGSDRKLKTQDILTKEKELDVTIEDLSQPYYKRKYAEVYTIYEQLSGMDDVKEAQNRVIVIQEELRVAQNKRRDFLVQLSDIRKDLQKVHSDISNCGRGDNRYLDLVKREIDLIQSEKNKLEEFQLADTTERELFSYLTNSVRVSHEKERIQSNNVKYWSIIGSILGALLGIIASALTYRYRNLQIEEIKLHSRNAVSEIVELRNKIEQLNCTILESIEKSQRGKLSSIQSESWGEYFKRHSVRAYRFFIPIR